MAKVKYKALFESLKKRILEGEFNADNPFPSELSLVRENGFSRQTVRAAFQQLRFLGLIEGSPGVAPRVTRQAALRKIGLIMPDVMQSEYFVKMFRELMRVTERRQYELLFGEFPGKTAKERASCAERLVEDFVRQQVVGVVFQPIERCKTGEDVNRRMLERLDAARIPVVLCDNDFAEGEYGHDVVGVNNVRAGVRMYRHLVAAGARRICYFMRPYSSLAHYERLQGACLAQLPDLTGNVRKESVLVAEPDDDKASRRRIRGGRVDAFMCGDDETAARLMQTLRKLGYSVPHDVLVSGFNDLRVAGLLSPTLTTMRIDVEKLADTAFRRLVARIANPKLPPTEIFLPVALVPRQSSQRGDGKRSRMK